MEMQKVKSSNINSVGYDKPSKTMYIEFLNGTYAYPNTEEDLYEQTINAPSIGKFFYSSIKGKEFYKVG